MNDIDVLKLLASWGGIAFLCTAITQGLKKALKWVENSHEALVSLVLGPTLAITAKLTGAMATAEGLAGWATVVIGGLMVGIGGGMVHDKAWNPVVSFASELYGKFFGKKKEEDHTA